jgi:hypothetical protein
MLLLVALAFIQVADLISTAYGFKRGLIEGNPFAAKMFARFGYWPPAIAIKLALLGICWAAQHFVSNGWILTAILCLIGIGVVVWNIRLLARRALRP